MTQSKLKECAYEYIAREHSRNRLSVCVPARSKKNALAESESPIRIPCVYRRNTAQITIRTNIPGSERPSRTHTRILHTRERIGRRTRDYTCRLQSASVRGQKYQGAGGGRQPFRAGRAAPTPILIKRSHKRLTNWSYVRRFIGVSERDVKMFQS